MRHNKSRLFAGQGPPSPPLCTSQALQSHESCPSSFTKFFLLFPPSQLSSFSFLLQRVAHGPAVEPLTWPQGTRMPRPCFASHLSRAPETFPNHLAHPLPPRGAVLGVEHVSSPTVSCVASCTQVWWLGSVSEPCCSLVCCSAQS